MDKIVLSQDGSNTVISEKYGVSYHSKHGAIQETETVFLEAGLQYVLELDNTKVVKIFEMGFGTGLNALMTLIKSNRHEIKIDYHTVEAYPIDLSLAEKLNYHKILEISQEEQDLFLKMHHSPSGTTLQLTKHLKFTKYIDKVEDLHLAGEYYNVIYYDAFAPSSQEELWTEEMMSKLYDATEENGCLVTYCAKGSFKRALRAAGYKVEGIPGPIGKREMTRAIKI